MSEGQGGVILVILEQVIFSWGVFVDVFTAWRFYKGLCVLCFSSQL